MNSGIRVRALQVLAISGLGLAIWANSQRQVATAFHDAGLASSHDQTNALGLMMIGAMVTTLAISGLYVPILKWKRKFRRRLESHPEETILEWAIPRDLRIQAERTERRVEIFSSILGGLFAIFVFGICAVLFTKMGGEPAKIRFLMGMLIALPFVLFLIASWFVQAWFRSGTRLGKGAIVKLRRDGWMVGGRIAGWTRPGQRLVELRLDEPSEFMPYWRLKAILRKCHSYPETDDPRPVRDGEGDTTHEAIKREINFRVPVPEDRLDDVRWAIDQIMSAKPN